MPPKKKQDVQVHVKSDAAYTELIARKGLKVIDVYSEWCGPAVAAVPTLKKIKLDTADDLLIMATANADKIEALSAYRGTCKPRFLFVGGDVIVGSTTGLNGPLLATMITDLLNKEHDALENDVARVAAEVEANAPPVAAAASSSASATTTAAASADASLKEVTFAMIKPTAIANEHADAIFAKIAEANMKVLKQDEITLDAERAGGFYAEHKGRDFYDNLVKFMSSGPVKPLVLAGEGVIKAWRALIGPTNTEKAKEEAPESLRALYGTDGTANAVHGSDSVESAHREIYFFFPEWAKENLEAGRAVVIVKPDALESGAGDEVEAALTAKGFAIEQTGEVTLTEALTEGAPQLSQILSAEKPAKAFIVARVAAADGLEGVASETVFVASGADDVSSLTPLLFPPQASATAAEGEGEGEAKDKGEGEGEGENSAEEAPKEEEKPQADLKPENDPPTEEADDGAKPQGEEEEEGEGKEVEKEAADGEQVVEGAEAAEPEAETATPAGEE